MDPDAALLRRIAQGDSTAVHALVSQKLPKVSALAERLLGDGAESEDVAQEAFLKVWRGAHRWRDDGRARFDTWLHTVVLNLCRDRLRRRGREHVMAEPPERADDAPGAEVGVQARQASARVRDALAKLPDRQREAIVLHHYQELSNQDAAQALGVSVEALESLLSRGRRTLRARLQEIA